MKDRMVGGTDVKIVLKYYKELPSLLAPPGPTICHYEFVFSNGDLLRHKAKTRFGYTQANVTWGVMSKSKVQSGGSLKHFLHILDVLM